MNLEPIYHCVAPFLAIRPSNRGAFKNWTFTYVFLDFACPTIMMAVSHEVDMPGLYNYTIKDVTDGTVSAPTLLWPAGSAVPMPHLAQGTILDFGQIPGFSKGTFQVTQVFVSPPPNYPSLPFEVTIWVKAIVFAS
jgi:hypothetical protein